MRYILFLVITTISVLTGQEQRMILREKEIAESNRLVDMILNESSKSIQNKFNISLCGIGAAMPGGIIEKFNLSFDVTGPIPKERLRNILIWCAQDVMKRVNDNKEIQKFLAQTPSTPENVQIILFVFDKDRRDLVEPNISTAEISHGFLTFRSTSKTTGMLQNDSRETYEDALKLQQA